MNHTPDTSDSDRLMALQSSLVIPVFVRSVYGNEHVYAADETQARFLSALTSSKTLTDSHRRALEGLGFSFSLVTDPRLMGSPLGATLFALGASAVNVPPSPVNPIQVVP